MVDYEQLRIKLETGIDKEVIPLLMEYIRVPSLSPLYDPDWEKNGLMEQAQDLLLNYVKNIGINGLKTRILKEDGKPWMFYGEVPASNPALGTILIYGHMDKQPHFPNWIPGTNNTEPAIIDGKLYGRGGADDGYSMPSAALLIKTLQDMNLPHGRIVIIGETEEESGSPNLMYLINQLKGDIGDPELIICLDSGAGDYDHLWLTSSLRGVIAAELTVSVIQNGLHSGEASGIVPSSFRIIRHLLDRIEDSATGEIKVPELFQEITPDELAKVESVAKVLGDSIFTKVEWDGNTQPMTHDVVQGILNKTLRPTLSVTGADGFPPLAVAGNVLRPKSSFKLSIRVPPAVNANQAFEKVKEALVSNPPYNATVDVRKVGAGNGFAPKPLDQWMSEVIQEASLRYFGAEALYMGEGGSIPFMGALADMFPRAKFVVTGVLGPNSNAHSANEFLHIPFMKKMMCCLGVLLAEHGKRVPSN
jgi:acetylornithine deacetylase/succinyl-diaminopimelate desuccinylase-like protein